MVNEFFEYAYFWLASAKQRHIPKVVHLTDTMIAQLLAFAYFLT